MEPNPDDLLIDIRILVSDILEGDEPDWSLDRDAKLAEMFSNLDRWMSTSGYLPLDWLGTLDNYLEK